MTDVSVGTMESGADLEALVPEIYAQFRAAEGSRTAFSGHKECIAILKGSKRRSPGRFRWTGLNGAPLLC